MNWIYNDGGRADAGYKGSPGDCVCRSIAIATQLPYQSIYDALNLEAKKERPRSFIRQSSLGFTYRKVGRSSARNGVAKDTLKRYLDSIGWVWTPTMQIGSGCKVHLRTEELPMGRLIVSVSKHLTCVIDGILYDTWDCSRDGNRCVYGYWHSPLTTNHSPETCTTPS